MLVASIPLKKTDSNSVGIYLLKVNNRNTRASCEICSQLTIKTPERRHWHCVFIFNFEYVIAGWDVDFHTVPKNPI